MGPERNQSSVRVKVTDYLTSRKDHHPPIFPHSICLSSDQDQEEKIFTAVEVLLSPFSSNSTTPSKHYKV